MENMTSEVWRLTGVTGSSPGVLTLEDGVVSLLVEDSNENLQQQFSLPIDQVSAVKWPKLQMSGGCSLEVGGEKYRISFLQPQNTRPLASSYSAVAGVASISGGRSAGKAWKAVLPS